MCFKYSFSQEIYLVMSITINGRKKKVPQCEVKIGSKPGCYKSLKGSILLVPDTNVTTSGKKVSAPTHCMVWDVDTELFIMKEINKLKGTYQFLCPLSELDLSTSDGDDL